MKYMENEKFSNELKKLLGFIENSLSRELPSPLISIEYFVLAFLQKKDCYAYNLLTNYLTSLAMNTIHDTYFELLNKKALSAVNPNRELKFDDKAQIIIDGAIKEAELLGDEHVTSVHLLLALLNEYIPNSSVTKVFNRAGVNYKIVTSKLDILKANGNNPETETTTPSKPGFGKIEILGVGSVSDLSDILSSVGASSSRVTTKKTSNSTIENYCTDITELARTNKLDNIIGREHDLDEMIKILCRRKKNNVIIVGGAGVGKTSLVHGLAHMINNYKVPAQLKNKRIMMLNPTTLVAGTQWRGMFEERLNTLMTELKKSKNTILFIDDISSVFNEKSTIEKDSGNAWGTLLENGDVQIIATTDFKGYHSTIDSNPTMSRRFQKVSIDPPTVDETINILKGLKPEYEKYHSVEYTDDAIVACCELSERYLTERNLPDSAIDVLDEVGAQFHIDFFRSDELDALYAERVKLDIKVELLKKQDKFDEADIEEKKSKELTVKILEIESEHKKALKKNPILINRNDVLEVFSRSVQIPLTQLNTNDKKSLSDLDKKLKECVIGQDEAIDKICNAIRRNRVGFTNSATYGSFFLIGRTGVGKTFIAKKLAQYLFGDENKIVRVDLSEYTDKTAVGKLIGSNPGYVGYEKGGLLTEAIKNKKHCVLLLDEIEKADTEIYNLFLQVLDEGFLTDNAGMKVDFKNVIILATSNIGAKTAATFGKGIGFNEDENKNQKNILTKELKKKFPPEFLNRFNDIIHFNSLSDDNLRKIINNRLEEIKTSLWKRNLKFTYYDCVVDYLMKVIEPDKEYGARPIARAIETEILDRITQKILDIDEPISEFVFSIDENDEIMIRTCLI
jgi:ATP-dependent Clp protease ATP-binding subunit ClpC